MRSGAPSQQVVESLRAAIRGRTAQHEDRLHKDVDDAKNVLVLLKQLDQRRQQRRPRANDAKASATSRVPPREASRDPSNANGSMQTDGGIVEHVGDHDGVREPSAVQMDVERALRQELRQTEEENDAMELFLLRHSVADEPTQQEARASAASRCTAWRHELTTLLDGVVLQTKCIVEARGGSSPRRSPEQATHQTAEQLHVLSQVTQRNRELLQACAVLEAEVQRISSDVEATLGARSGIAWGMSDVAVRPLPTTRGLAPGPVWSRLAQECRQWVNEANMVLDGCMPAASQFHQDALDGVRNQWAMIRRHLLAASTEGI